MENRQLDNDSTPWKGQVELNVYAIKNNASLFRLGSGSQIEYHEQKNTYLSLNELRLILSRGRDLENRGFQHFRYQRELNDLISLEVFTQFQFDQILRIKIRQLNGIGPRFRIHKKGKERLFVGVHYMYEYEEEYVTGNINRDHRMSSHITVSKKFERSVINGIVYYQPLFTDFSDYRISASTAYSIELRTQLYFNIRLELAHDSNPVEGVTELTYTLVNGFNLAF